MFSPYKTIIVDDEQDALDTLFALLGTIAEIELAGQANSVDKAMGLIDIHHTDLVFLDIEMPEKNGFDLVKQLKQTNHKPTIVFVTAFDKYAIEAIKHAAFDYLLKPVDPDDLEACINRLKESAQPLNFVEQVDSLLQKLQPSQKIRFNVRTGYIFIDPTDIVYCEADGSYTQQLVILLHLLLIY